MLQCTAFLGRVQLIWAARGHSPEVGFGNRRVCTVLAHGFISKGHLSQRAEPALWGWSCFKNNGLIQSCVAVHQGTVPSPAHCSGSWSRWKDAAQTLRVLRGAASETFCTLRNAPFLPTQPGHQHPRCEPVFTSPTAGEAACCQNKKPPHRKRKTCFHMGGELRLLCRKLFYTGNGG